MHEDLVRLQQMDGHDRAADRAARAAQALREARQAAEAKLAAAEEALAAIEQRAQTLRREELDTQRALEQARTYRARAERALASGMGDPDAAQRQLDATSEQIDKLETKLLEHMEATDTLGDERQAALAAIDVAGTELAQLLETWEAELAAREAEAAREADAVRSLAEGLPAELRDRYDAMRAKGRWAVARIREGACHACNKVVTQQHISDLRRGLLKPCLGCHRFLVLGDAA